MAVSREHMYNSVQLIGVGLKSTQCLAQERCPRNVYAVPCLWCFKCVLENQ